ncbi:phage minor tail protein G [Providencia heimbachae]|uniref:Phage minor tail protein n=2 Tax=Providencia heimbachae TaxID=333962 RepID=A0A1B7JGG4_9GAMM|nr:phage minor tail protein [Providencia heimbachae ATCC 35613]SQH13028.1 phage minor tail protein G [Providencia heimbachae]
MFLKKKEVSFGDEQIVLHELSALQRADYFDFLAKQEKSMEGLEGVELGAKSMRAMAESQAWLVSRSLWHNDRDRDVEEVYEEVAQTWSGSSLDEAVRAISEISGMTSAENDDDASESETESLEK